MGKAEAEFAIKMADRQGWNPGLHDCGIFYDTDPNGFFVAEMDGQLVGCASAVAYDNTFGFMGFHVIRPDFRKKGIGLKLTETCLKYMGIRNVGLNGIVQKEDKYQLIMNFRPYYQNFVFEGIAEENKIAVEDGNTGKKDSKGTDKKNDVKMDPETVKMDPVNGNRETIDRIMGAKDVPFDLLLDYDSKMFPANRKIFLEKWINQQDAYSFVYFNGESIKGYGVLRKCISGYKVGPLFADSPKIAEELFEAMKGSIPGELIYIDVPVPNENALKLARKNNMSVVFKTVRMYNKQLPETNLGNVYGITTIELG